MATPAFAALVVDWATDVPFRTAARRVGEATAGAVSGSTAWRLLQQVAAAGHGARGGDPRRPGRATAALPPPVGARVVPVLYLEADGVWVKTQREPAHRTGYELKCASMYEGWRVAGGPDAGPPAPALPAAGEAGVLPRARPGRRAGAHPLLGGGEPGAWRRTYDLSRIPLVVVGGDGANWLDTALEGFPQAVRQRDGFHLARDAARGWGPDAGATLYQAVRAGDQATAARPPRLARPAARGPAAPAARPRPRRPRAPGRGAPRPPPALVSGRSAAGPGRPSSARSRTPTPPPTGASRCRRSWCPPTPAGWARWRAPTPTCWPSA